MEERNWLMGLWKFGDRISLEQLEDVAKKWAAEDPNYLQLYIRKVSKNQVGIGFAYQISEGKDRKEAFDEYFHRTTDYLKRSFGNDLVGWDVASQVYVIK